MSASWFVSKLSIKQLSVGADHMLSEKLQGTQNGTIVDLDWPLNASSPLSASAELVVS